MGKQGGHSLYSRDLRLLLYGKHTFEYDVKSSFWAMALAFRKNVRALLGINNVQQLREMVDEAMAGPKRTWPTQAKDILAWALNMQPAPCLEKIKGMGFPLPPGIQELILKLHEVKNLLRAEDSIADGDVGGDPRVCTEALNTGPVCAPVSASRRSRGGRLESHCKPPKP